MVSLHRTIKQLEENLQAEQAKYVRAEKAKNRAVKAAEKLKDDMSNCEGLLSEVEHLRRNEEKLLRKVRECAACCEVK